MYHFNFHSIFTTALRSKVMGYVLLMLMLPCLAVAQNFTFAPANANTASWNNPSNWVGNNIPTTGAAVTIRNPKENNTLTLLDVPVEMTLSAITLEGEGTFTVVMEAGANNSMVYLGTPNGPKEVLHLPSTANLVFAGGKATRWIINEGHTANIEGTVRFEGNGNTQTLEAKAPNAIVFKAGSMVALGSSTQPYDGFPFGATGANGTVVFEAGSKLVQYDGQDPFGAAGTEKITFNSGSLFQYAAVSNTHKLQLSGHHFANLQFSSTQASATLSGTASIAGDLTLDANMLVAAASRSTLALQGSQTIGGKGNLQLGSHVSLMVAEGAKVNQQTNIEVQDATAAAYSVVEVVNGARLNIINEHFIFGNGRFILHPGGTLGIGSKDGIALETFPLTIPRRVETTKGNVRNGSLTTRQFAAGAHYVYMGSKDQETGSGLPLNTTWRGNSLPQPKLTIATQSNEVTVTLTRTVRTSIFTLEKGIFNTTIGTNRHALRIMGHEIGGIHAGQIVRPENGGTLKTGNTVFEFQGPVQVQAQGAIHFNDIHIINTANWAPAVADFGATGRPVIEGILYLHSGGSVAGNGPIYSNTLGEGSIIYQTMEPHYRGAEWMPAGERGTPHHVQVRSKTTLLAAGVNGSLANAALTMNGNLTLYKSSDFEMDAAMQQPLVVGGNMEVSGRFSGSANVAGNVQIAAEAAMNLTTAAGNQLKATNITIAGSLKANSSQIAISGNWERHALTGTFEANTSTVTFTGNNSSLAVTNTNNAVETFYNLQLAKSSVANALILNSGVQVQQQLDLQTGRIVSTAAFAVAVTGKQADGAQQGIKGGSQNSFVQGVLVRHTQAGAGSYLLPTGSFTDGLAQYRPLMLSAVSADDIFTVAYHAAVAPAQNGSNQYNRFDGALTGIIGSGHWQLAAGAATTTATVATPYSMPAAPRSWVSKSGQAIAPATGSLVGFATGTEGHYTLQNGEIAYNQAGQISGSFKANGLFTVGFTGNTILPIGLARFTAALQQRDGMLSWQLGNEADRLQQMELEYSTDGINFSKLTQIAARAGQIEYSYRHRNLDNGSYHYRIVMTATDGDITLSDTKQVSVLGNQTLITGLLQNPIVGGRAVVQIYSAQSQKAEMVMIDNSGRTIQQFSIQLQAGNNNSQLAMGNLAGGIYRLMVKTNDGIQKVMPVSIY